MKATFVKETEFPLGTVLDFEPEVLDSQVLLLTHPEYEGIDGMSLKAHGNPFNLRR